MIRVPALVATALLLLPVGGPAYAQGAQGAVEATDSLKFTPAEITVPVGGTVTWTNAGATFHTVTGGENAADPASPIGNENLAAKGATYKVTFATAGRYPYFCSPHIGSQMKGVVVVGAAASASPEQSPEQSPEASGSPTPAGEPAAEEPGEGSGEVPGIEGNKLLEELEAERASEKSTLGGFRAFTAASTAALFALSIALFASTRTRRNRA